MLRTLSRTFIISTLLLGTLGSLQAAPASSIDVRIGPNPAVQLASFWGRPYPYGYAYHRHRHARVVRVETRRVWRVKRVQDCGWKRVRVCR